VAPNNEGQSSFYFSLLEFSDIDIIMKSNAVKMIGFIMVLLTLASARSCCPPFDGFLASVCLNENNFGDGECTSSGWKISCSGYWETGNVLGTQTIQGYDMEACYAYCTNRVPGTTAIDFTPSDPPVCNCFDDESGFVSDGSSSSFTYTSDPICGN
jgi:hypothetical protein